MPMTRREIMLAAAATAATAAAGCAARPTLTELGIYGAGAGSNFLPYAEGLAVQLSAHGLATRAIESAGSTENLRRVDSEPGRLGLAFMGTVQEALAGTERWTEGRRHSAVRALFPMYETSFQFVALAATGIGSLSALRDRRVGVGPAGGPAEGFFRGLVEATGLPCVIVNGTPAALVADTLAGRIDALWQGAPVPIPSIAQVADSASARVFGLSAAERDAMLLRFPALAPATVPAGRYRGQGDALQSVAAWNFVIANAALPDADAYWVTKTVLALPDPLRIHASAAATTAENARLNRLLPFHPGAQRYYRERDIALAV